MSRDVSGEPSTSRDVSGSHDKGEEPVRKTSTFRNLLQKYTGISVTPRKLSELMNATDSEDERIRASEIERRNESTSDSEGEVSAYVAPKLPPRRKILAVRSVRKKPKTVQVINIFMMSFTSYGCWLLLMEKVRLPLPLSHHSF